MVRIEIQVLRGICRRIDFGSSTFVEDFNHPTFSVSDRTLYSENMITLKDNVEVKEDKLLLHVRYGNKEFSSWWGTKLKTWSIGLVECKKRSYPYGIWSVECKLPNDNDGLPAVWLLRERHPEPETKIDLGKGQKTAEHELFLPEWTNQRDELVNW